MGQYKCKQTMASMNPDDKVKTLSRRHVSL